jgi:hypothetical protein
MTDDHRLRSDVRLILIYTLLFARLGRFWRRSFPALVDPYPLLRLRRRLARGTPPLGPAAGRITIDPRVPAQLPVKHVEEVELRIVNNSEARLTSTGRYPFCVAHLWLEEGSKSGVIQGAAPLPRSLGAGEHSTFWIRLPTPAREGDYGLQIWLLQAGGAQPDPARDGNAWAGRVRIEPYRPLEDLAPAIASTEASGV